MSKNQTVIATRCRSSAAIAAGSLLLVLIAPPGVASAADTQAAWQGLATTTASTTAQCDGAYGTLVGDVQVSVFQPKIKSTDTNTFLSFVFLRAAETWENLSESTIHQMHGSGKLEGYGIGSHGQFYDFAGTYSLTITPASITTSTSVVTIKGTIVNYADFPGCTVTFSGVYSKRID
ncbi:MAG TPA: hypothetical protein VMF05_03240 [Stellaceae bacterium]|nr:hypothetical protein [Stellaceae bacterium]